MSDVFDRLVGQDRAVASMRQYAKGPVHAYLFTGPPGTSVHDALITFAAALQCPEHGCGSCEHCRLVLEGQDPDVFVTERVGATWRLEEIREAERVGRRRPLGAGYQIVLLEDVELTATGASPNTPALLKSLEEPPPRTIYLLSAEELPDALDTVVSRCVEIHLRALGDDDIENILVGEGASRDVARDAAWAASGNLRRARVLVGDDGLATRVAQWRAIPDRLSGTPAVSATVAREISSTLDDALAPLRRVQDDEMAARNADAKEIGLRSVTGRRDVEAQFKREQRRFRLDELRFGLSALTTVYRERLIESLDASRTGDARGEYRVGAALRAIDAITEANRRLATNMDESLLLHDLLFELMEY